MIEIVKNNEQSVDRSTNKLIIKTPKDFSTTEKITPKALTKADQNIQPEEKQEAKNLFEIY
jgi:hypothetical protein